MRIPCYLTVCLGLLLHSDEASASPRASGPEDFRAMVEADWLMQETYRRPSRARLITPETDALGACDGIKTGKWGFHTDLEVEPWWQVDLGEVRRVARVRIWNRCDHGEARRAARLQVLTSDDGKQWRRVYQHDGTVFQGRPDGKPLVVRPKDVSGRFVRIQLPGKHPQYLHLDEVEVFGPKDRRRNLALRRPANQSSVSKWSSDSRPAEPIQWGRRTKEILDRCRGMLDELRAVGADVSAFADALAKGERRFKQIGVERADKALCWDARWLQRRLTFATLRRTKGLLDFDAMLVTQRVPGTFNHMSDQYYGWWSRPGGGIYIVRDFTTDTPKAECITQSFTEPGSFLRPMISYDAKKVLFAWCKHYPKLAAEKDKLNKDNVPEDAFYHIFEMNIDGSGVRKLTHGKYDDFDARYLPDGRIVFLSTRRGQSIQVGKRSAACSVSRPDLPDIYVRCGGGPERPVAVYTLHTMNADGSDLCAISPFEMFEWTPTVAHNGTILYSRWDYVDRWNMPFMSLWAINPDGTNSRIVYGNYTHAPHCTFEPRCVPGSEKIVFTASGHHAQTMGCLVLLDPTQGTEGDAPITRLTPEVPFPEIEGWSETYFANPWPLSERFHLVSWCKEDQIAQWQKHRRPNGWGIYLFDAEGDMELLYRDPEISTQYPIPIKPRPRPHTLADRTQESEDEGRFLLIDVGQGLRSTKRDRVKAIRIVAVPGKTHPTMNYPSIGLTRDDPGKCVLGTVPVEADGSAHFRVPAGVIVFFQALDERGMAIQTMRSTTHVQPGQTLSCIGCHESRSQAPPQQQVLAAQREPSKITVGPPGSWPLRFDKLVEPVVQRRCMSCHNARATNEHAARYDLTGGKAYAALYDYQRWQKPSLRYWVTHRYRQGYSSEGQCLAATSAVLEKVAGTYDHHGVRLEGEDLERFVVWMDTYAQRLGSFSDDQERRLVELRKRHRDLLNEREPSRTAMMK